MKNDFKNKKILRLTLHKKAFEITGTEEKPFELRKKSAWIKSRIYRYFGIDKFVKFDYVLFVNGYGNRPYKIYKADKIIEIESDCIYEFSNGIKFEVEKGDYMICLGEFVTSGEDISELGFKPNKYRLYKKIKAEGFQINKKDRTIYHPDAIDFSENCKMIAKHYSHNLQNMLVPLEKPILKTV